MTKDSTNHHSKVIQKGTLIVSPNAYIDLTTQDQSTHHIEEEVPINYAIDLREKASTKKALIPKESCNELSSNIDEEQLVDHHNGQTEKVDLNIDPSSSSIDKMILRLNNEPSSLGIDKMIHVSASSLIFAEVVVVAGGVDGDKQEQPTKLEERYLREGFWLMLLHGNPYTGPRTYIRATATTSQIGPLVGNP